MGVTVLLVVVNVLVVAVVQVIARESLEPILCGVVAHLQCFQLPTRPTEVDHALGPGPEIAGHPPTWSMVSELLRGTVSVQRPYSRACQFRIHPEQ